MSHGLTCHAERFPTPELRSPGRPARRRHLMSPWGGPFEAAGRRLLRLRGPCNDTARHRQSQYWNGNISGISVRRHAVTLGGPRAARLALQTGLICPAHQKTQRATRTYKILHSALTARWTAHALCSAGLHGVRVLVPTGRPSKQPLLRPAPPCSTDAVTCLRHLQQLHDPLCPSRPLKRPCAQQAWQRV